MKSCFSTLKSHKNEKAISYTQYLGSLYMYTTLQNVQIKHLNNSADDIHFYETITSLISIFITERSSNSCIRT